MAICTRRELGVLLAMGAALLLSSCGDGALPERTLRRDDCLRDVDLEALPQSIRRCDQVVARYPADPLPRNERSLLLALSGDDQGACRDIAKAHDLVQRTKPGSLDPLLVSEIQVRRSSCREKR